MAFPFMTVQTNNIFLPSKLNTRLRVRWALEAALRALLMAYGLVLAGAAGAADEAQDRCNSADLFLHNAMVYTVDAVNSEHEAVVIDDGRFVYVGTYVEAMKHWCGAKRVIDL